MKLDDLARELGAELQRPCRPRNHRSRGHRRGRSRPADLHCEPEIRLVCADNQGLGHPRDSGLCGSRDPHAAHSESLLRLRPGGRPLLRGAHLPAGNSSYCGRRPYRGDWQRRPHRRLRGHRAGSGAGRSRYPAAPRRHLSRTQRLATISSPTPMRSFARAAGSATGCCCRMAR